MTYDPAILVDNLRQIQICVEEFPQTRPDFDGPIYAKFMQHTATRLLKLLEVVEELAMPRYGVVAMMIGMRRLLAANMGANLLIDDLNRLGVLTRQWVTMVGAARCLHKYAGEQAAEIENYENLLKSLGGADSEPS